jgi:hypothetical protein
MCPTGEKGQDLLTELLMLFTVKGDTVFDPAFGSGSMMVAAVNTGRHFVGWECDLEAFKVCFFPAPHEKSCFAWQVYLYEQIFSIVTQQQ